MHYSWVGFVYHAVVWLGERLAEKLFDIGLVALGTWVGYRLAKHHLEQFVTDIVGKMDAKYLNLIGTMDAKYLNLINEMDAKYLNLINGMDAKYLNLNRETAFHRAVNAMLPELPEFHLRPEKTLRPEVAGALAEFTSWSTAIDATHTDQKSMELVVKEAHTLAAKLVAKDMMFKEEVSVPKYKWEIAIRLPSGAKMEEAPYLTIFNWDAGLPLVRYATMKETERVADYIHYVWMWDTKDVPCCLYAGVVNFTIGATANTPRLQRTAMRVGERLRIFLKMENDQVIKTQENVPW